MKTKSQKFALLSVASIGVVALLVGCASAPEDKKESSSTKESDFLPCMVSDAGGFDDKSFNQSSYEGMKTAAEDLGVEVKTAESNAETDFANNIDSLIDADCNLIVSVGFALAEATEAAAESNPDVDFAIVDFDIKDKDNVRPIIFDTVGAAFLAGYAAADTTKTGVVGTYGGMQFPSVTIFMDGFAEGVEYYNKENNKAVKVLGWDVKNQKGAFTGGFEANETAKTIASGLIDQNADIIMPVGGPIYTSAAAAIEDSGKDIGLVGVDSDLYDSDPKYQKMYFTSVLKGLAKGVEETVREAYDDKFTAEAYVGNLENEGIGIAPFHDWESKVKPDLKDKLDKLKTDLISGTVKVTSVSSPK